MADLPPSRILNYLHKMFNVRAGQALPQYAALSGRSSSDPFSYGQTQYSEDRLSRLREYDAMDLSSTEAWVALNTYAEESTQFSLDKKRTIWATSEDPEVVDIIHTFFDEIGVEEKSFGLNRHMCKYGEAFVFPVISAGAGVVDLIVPHPSLVKIRFDENDYNKVIGYNCEALDIIQPSEMGYENPPMPKDIQVRSGEGFGPWDWVHFKIPGSDLATHYGASMMEGARRVWKTLAMLETAVALFRINKAGPRLFHKIFTGTSNPSEIYKIVENYIKSVRQTPFLSIKDPATGGDGSLEEYLNRYKQNGFLEDIFMGAPKDAESDVTVLDVPFDLGALQDLEYWKTKYRTGWGIPKAYFDGDITGWGANKALSQQDVQFARKAERIQKSYIGGMNILCGLHLLYRGKTKFSFTLHMEPPSALGVLQKLEVQQIRLTQMAEWMSVTDSLGVDKVKWVVKGMEEIMGMSRDEIKELLVRIPATSVLTPGGAMPPASPGLGADGSPIDGSMASEPPVQASGATAESFVDLVEALRENKENQREWGEEYVVTHDSFQEFLEKTSLIPLQVRASKSVMGNKETEDS